ncbi:helix-turn-helix domain-containing protein [Streptomyces sp. NPDC048623]|uniref:helix-turn-helix transcriptional regulator n=1 Tax=Streptomyces sp. NPDC048623 TaxID=3155761 RepID=UPI00341D1595
MTTADSATRQDSAAPQDSAALPDPAGLPDFAGLPDPAGPPPSPRCSGPHLVPLYRELRRRGLTDFAEASAVAGVPERDRERSQEALLALGLIVPAGSAHVPTHVLRAEDWRPDSGAVAAVEPTMAMMRFLEQEHARLQEDSARADRAYRTLKTLAGTYLQAEVFDHAEVAAEVLTDYGRIQQVLEDMVDLAQRQASAMYPTRPGRLDPERLLDRDRRRLDRGVRCRSVYDRAAIADPATAEVVARRAALGVEVRIAPVVPVNLVAADERFALVPIRPNTPGEGAILIRGEALVRSYLTLYEYCWHMAVPYGDDAAASAERGGDGLSAQQRAVLRMLATGTKDEKIARTLGVSLRTVSRLISELMQELGASTRFEAGVRAHRLGLLDGGPSVTRAT